MSDGKVFKHQDFAVEETARKKIIRQDRMYLNSSKCKLLIDGLTYEVFNITAFGTAIIANEIQLRSIQKKNEKEARIEATLIYESYEVQKIYLRYVRDEIHPTAAHNERIVGFEVLGEI